jgi:hypothetical protein
LTFSVSAHKSPLLPDGNTFRKGKDEIALLQVILVRGDDSVAFAVPPMALCNMDAAEENGEKPGVSHTD